MNSMPLVWSIHIWDANFKTLECRNSKFTDNTVMNIIKSAPQLTRLDLSETKDINNKTLEKAATLTASRTNNTILQIFVGGTSVNLSTFNNTSPLLQVVIAL